MLQVLTWLLIMRGSICFNQFEWDLMSFCLKFGISTGNPRIQFS